MIVKAALIDDNASDLLELRKAIELFTTDTLIFELSEYSNGFNEGLYKKAFDLYFVDIEMPNINGFEVFKQITLNNENAIVVFVTNHANFVFDAIKLNPCYFIRKNNLKEDLKHAIVKIENTLINKNSKFIFEKNNVLQSIPLKNIVYFETLKNNLFINTINESISIRKTMKQLLKEIKSNDFIHIHYSFLVNYKFIKDIDDRNVKLINNTKLPITKGKSTEIKRLYTILMMR